MQSFIGKWIDELAMHFDEVGLLLHESSTKSLMHDTEIRQKNIKLHSLGKSGNYIDRFERMARIKKVCRSLDQDYDILLIRGITPRQYTIYKYCKAPKKAFLLVGSITDSKPKFSFSILGMHAYIMYYLRRYEINKISSGSRMFANSPKIVQELKLLMNIASEFVPTNTISYSEIEMYAIKKINKNELNILFCGRIVRDKGIFELLDAFYKLKLLDYNVKLTIVGKLCGSIESDIKSLPYYYIIKDHLVFKGFIPYGPLLFEEYSKANFYILPSYHEGFPHSIWEASATSTPIFVTPVGGIPGLLTENEVFFIDVKSSDSIVEKIVYAINDPLEVHKRVTQMSERVKDFTVENCAKILANKLNADNTHI